MGGSELKNKLSYKGLTDQNAGEPPIQLTRRMCEVMCLMVQHSNKSNRGGDICDRLE